LGADTIVPIFEQFVKQYPCAHSSREKMLLVDRLIHEFHWDTKRKAYNRSVTNNLIEGNKFAVLELLDQLSGGESAAKEQWRATLAGMYPRRWGRKEQMTKPPAPSDADKPCR
jgi:hypothetical protein